MSFELIKQIALSSVITGVILPIVLKYFINSYFNKKLESHKHDLAIISETVKFEHQRKIQDFQLYTNKRHSIYPELHKLMLNTISDVKLLMADSYFPPFEQYSDEMLRSYLTENEVREETIKIC